jgi:hypothetical protein
MVRGWSKGCGKTLLRQKTTDDTSRKGITGAEKGAKGRDSKRGQAHQQGQDGASSGV